MKRAALQADMLFEAGYGIVLTIVGNITVGNSHLLYYIFKRIANKFILSARE